MDSPTTNKPVADTKAKDSTNELGISKGIYAVGQATKEGVLWGVGTTILATAVLFFGRKEGNLIDKGALLAENAHNWVKKALGFSDKQSSQLTSAFAIATIVGGLVGHIANVPGFDFGHRKAKIAIEKYNNLSAESAQLAAENARLKQESILMKEDSAQLNEALTKAPSPLERLNAQAQAPEPAGMQL